MQRPIQNAEKFPATNPDKMFSDAPPCLEQLVTSRTWRAVVLTKTLVNSGINAPATVPQLMITDSTHHRFGWATPFIWKSPSNNLLARKVTPMETAEVIQTRCVSGASKSKSFWCPYLALLNISLRKYETSDVTIISARMTNSQMISVAHVSGEPASARARTAISATPVTP